MLHLNLAPLARPLLLLTLQAPVLILERSRPLRIRHFHTAVLGLPVIQRLIRDAQFARDFLHRRLAGNPSWLGIKLGTATSASMAEFCIYYTC